MIAGRASAANPNAIFQPVCVTVLQRCEPEAEAVTFWLQQSQAVAQNQLSRTGNLRRLLGIVLAAGVSFFVAPSTNAKVTVTLTNYHGWLEAYQLSNGKAEVVVVPAVGRVMQFGFVGEEGVFWENRALDGRIVDGRPLQWSSGQWVNFGGDKTWPSPEADWGLLTGRKDWRPPPAFDGIPAEARVDGRTLVLLSPVDSFFGIRTQRRIRLHPSKPEMTITTTYERVSGEPAKVGVWVITQLKEPVGLFAPLPGKSVFTNGYTLLGKNLPPSVKTTNGLVSLLRETKGAYKIGLDADSLLWVGEKHVLRIDAPRLSGVEYPDKGSSTEIYTNPDPLQYIELETLGPQRVMKPGDKIQHRNTYTLKRRSLPTPEAEARAAFRR